VEGIFRLSGSEKRIKELKTLFDSPDRYGKGLVWDGYTVHDAANVLRRYLNDLPEPVVPLDLYEKFRDPLRGATKQAAGDAEGPQFIENFDEKAAIVRYQKLITELPPLNRQLLLYILDLLAVFAAKSDENRMNSQNLAAIFQPGMLSHPAHAMAPEEYRLNQCVLIFLIENQDHFLIGMQGTAADENTKKEVELGTGAATAGVPVTPTRNNKTSIGRSSSNASAGADSVRRDGMVRRNRSVSSRHSKQDGNTTPNSPALVSTPTTGGLSRSNTVPSKKSPALAGSKFGARSGNHSPYSPVHLDPLTQAHPVGTPTQSDRSSLAPPAGGLVAAYPGPPSTAGRSQERLLSPHESTTPQKERNLQSIFQRSPTDEGKRQPNKLKKKRVPGSMNPSAQSSNASLPPAPSTTISPSTEGLNPMEQIPQEGEPTNQLHPQPLVTPPIGDGSSDPTPKASPNYGLDGQQAEDSSKSTTPLASAPISSNVQGEMNQGAPVSAVGAGTLDEKKSKDSPEVTAQPAKLEELINTSNSSLTASTQRPRKSFAEESMERPSTVTSSELDSNKDGRERSKDPIGWIKNKYREAKENAEQRRNKSPPAEGHGNGHSLLSRGKSLDLRRDKGEREARGQRETREEEKQPQVPQEPTIPKIVAPQQPTEMQTTPLTPAPEAAPTTTPEPTLKTDNQTDQNPALEPGATTTQTAATAPVAESAPQPEPAVPAEPLQVPQPSEKAPVADVVPSQPEPPKPEQ
jgi:hypothetical protein